MPSHRSLTNGARSTVSSCRNSVCSIRASSSRSSTSRPIARDLGLHEALDAANLLERRVRLRREHLELSGDHGQRRAQLV